MADNSRLEALTATQQRAVLALRSEASVRKAADASGIKERTIYNWLKTPDFDAAYREARREAVKQGIARLQHGTSAAVGVLFNPMANGTPAVKLGAARTVLEMGIKVLEIEDLAVRLEALEKVYAEKL
jgi:hypothetical protein